MLGRTGDKATSKGHLTLTTYVLGSNRGIRNIRKMRPVLRMIWTCTLVGVRCNHTFPNSGKTAYSSEAVVELGYTARKDGT